MLDSILIHDYGITGFTVTLRVLLPVLFGVYALKLLLKYTH